MTDQSFPKKNRLLTRDDFQDLRPESRRFVSGSLIFYYKFNDKSSNSRMGISVSKKIGNAVKRNRVKRLIRECFRVSECKHKSLDFLVTVSTRNFNKNNSESFYTLEQSIKENFNFGLKKILKKHSVKF